MTPTPKVVVSASIAYDHIMHFDGSFQDHILEDKAHVISVSFLLGSLKQQRGGVAGPQLATGRDMGGGVDELRRLRARGDSAVGLPVRRHR